MRECLVFEVADRELDDRVLTVLGFDELQRLGAVGQKREVSPIGPQLGLGSEQPRAPDDQAWSETHLRIETIEPRTIRLDGTKR